MSWRVVEIWKDHEIQHRDGSVTRVRAEPAWNEKDCCFRVFPFGNENADSVMCTSLSEVYVWLSKGYGVRVKYRETGTNAILWDGFEARMRYVR